MKTSIFPKTKGGRSPSTLHATVMGTGVAGGPHGVVIALGPHGLAGGRADVPVYLSPVGLALHPPVGSPSPTHEASHSFIDASGICWLSETCS